MDEKLRKLMKHEGINSTRLAEILGIQASGISHIMSGRNRPSSDFLIKLLQHFPQISADWLMRSSGPMYISEVKNKPAEAPKSAPMPAQTATSSASMSAQINSGATQAAFGSVNAGLFGPDNRDIIPAQSPARPSAHPSTFGGQFPPATTDISATSATPQTPPTGPQTDPRSVHIPVAQQPVYQAGGFTRSSMIERIVVFYKDKTFSEYQPE